jgi:hypothetical protein
MAANVTFNNNCKKENGELRIRGGIKRKITMVMFMLQQMLKVFTILF